MNSSRGLERRRATPESPAEQDSQNEVFSNEDISSLYTNRGLQMEGWLAKKFPQLSTQDVQDIVIESFIKLVQKGRQGEIQNMHEGSVLAFLRKTILNKAIDYLRRSNRMLLEPETGEESVDTNEWIDAMSVAQGDIERDTPESLLLDMEQNVEMLALVQRALNTPGLLNDEQRTILEMRFFQDKKHADIATELGIAPGTSMTREYYALQKIRRRFGVADVKLRPRKKQESPVDDSIGAAAAK